MSTKPKNIENLVKIYVLKDPETLEIRYVGKTVKELIKRLGEHIYESKKKTKNTYKCNWINSILTKNKLPIIEQIDECNWDESETLEIYYIAKFKSLGYNLVNSTDGGEGVLGRKCSEETIKKFKDSSRKNLPKVYQYSLDGILLKEWNNAPEAAEKLGFKNASGITRCLRGERFKYKNYIWKLEIVNNAAKDLEENNKLKHQKNIEKSRGGYSQSILAKIISQESKLAKTPYYFVYSSNNISKETLLYEGISAKDVASYINNDLQRQDISIESTISRLIKTGELYYNKYYISNISPNNYVYSKHKALIIIHYNDYVFYGVEEAALFFNVTKTNIINNLKGITKNLNTKDFGKIKLTWEINKEHGRLYMKTYGLSAGEIEESVKETSS